MHLSEELINSKEEIFLNFLDTIIEEIYDMNEEYEMTDDDAYIASIIMDYFVDNYKMPSVNEAVYESVTGRDINEELYDEIIDIILDESVGSFVAGAAHGIRNFISKVRYKRSQNVAKNAAKAASATNQKTQQATKAAKMSAKTDSGITGALKGGFHAAKVAKLQDRAKKARSVAGRAATEREYRKSINKSNVASSKRLANKIDTGINNVKQKVKNTVQQGASKFGSAIGRVAGAFA
jgi:hypothetical protein